MTVRAQAHCDGRRVLAYAILAARLCACCARSYAITMTRTVELLSLRRGPLPSQRGTIRHGWVWAEVSPCLRGRHTSAIGAYEARCRYDSATVSTVSASSPMVTDRVVRPGPAGEATAHWPREQRGRGGPGQGIDLEEFRHRAHQDVPSPCLRSRRHGANRSDGAYRANATRSHGGASVDGASRRLAERVTTDWSSSVILEPVR